MLLHPGKLQQGEILPGAKRKALLRERMVLAPTLDVLAIVLLLFFGASGRHSTIFFALGNRSPVNYFDFSPMCFFFLVCPFVLRRAREGDSGS